MSRPLSKVFEVRRAKDKKTRTAAIRSAVIDHSYSLKEVADFLGIHYSTASRMVRREPYARNKT